MSKLVAYKVLCYLWLSSSSRGVDEGSTVPRLLFLNSPLYLIVRNILVSVCGGGGGGGGVGVGGGGGGGGVGGGGWGGCVGVWVRCVYEDVPPLPPPPKHTFPTSKNSSHAITPSSLCLGSTGSEEYCTMAFKWGRRSRT